MAFYFKVPLDSYIYRHSYCDLFVCFTLCYVFVIFIYLVRFHVRLNFVTHTLIWCPLGLVNPLLSICELYVIRSQLLQIYYITTFRVIFCHLSCLSFYRLICIYSSFTYARSFVRTNLSSFLLHSNICVGRFAVYYNYCNFWKVSRRSRNAKDIPATYSKKALLMRFEQGTDRTR